MNRAQFLINVGSLVSMAIVGTSADDFSVALITTVLFQCARAMRLVSGECYAVLCYAFAILCYSLLFFAILCYALLCFAMLCYFFYAMLCCAAHYGLPFPPGSPYPILFSYVALGVHNCFFCCVDNLGWRCLRDAIISLLFFCRHS